MISKMFAAIALAAVVAMAAPSADRVKSLPLFNGTFPSRHYSGYLTALNGSYLHYYLVEASDVDPATAPVVWWMNGGPGCSSMDGWGYELGPFTFKNYQTGGATFKLNPYTWTKNATVVFVEAPPGVGFSWREDGNYTISDSENARNNHAAVVDLLHNKFPEYLNNRFFVAGESYAGIYVPTLAYEILMHGGVPNFEGILVGNGVTSSTYDSFIYGDAKFALGHGFITEKFFNEASEACLPNENSAVCNIFQNVFWERFLPHINFYGAYLNCFTLPDYSWKHIPTLRRYLKARARATGRSVDELIAEANEIAKTVPPSPPSGDAGVPCIDFEVMKSYLNRADVKKALHVHESLRFDLCYDINYVEDIPSVLYVYTALLQANKSVLVFNGNTDMAVPYTGTEAWMATMNWTSTRHKQSWNYVDSAYPYGAQTAGMATQYENKLWFVLVNGAGHMVSQTRRPAALDMFQRFISGRGF